MENNFIKLASGYTADIYYNKETGIVKKHITKFLDHDVFKREVYFLEFLNSRGYIWCPKLLNYNAETHDIYIEYVGEPINNSNVPKDWCSQLTTILNDLTKENLAHNDINLQNVLVKNKRLYLIDFGWTTIKNDWTSNGLFVSKPKPNNIYPDTDALKRFECIKYRLRGSDITVGVMTRIQYIEAPYLNEFIEWYKNLGFTKIHFLNTEPKYEKRIREFIEPEFDNFIEIHDHKSSSINNLNYTKNLIRNMPYDYILHVDSDEYFMLPKMYSTIGDYILTCKADKYKFYWLNVAIDKLYVPKISEHLKNNNSKGRYCGSYKMMVNREKWISDPRSKIDPHNLTFSGGSVKSVCDPKFTGSQPYLIHVLVRGYLHTMLKVLHQKLPTNKTSGKEEAKKFLNANSVSSIRSYPNRVLLASAEYCIESKSVLENARQKWFLPSITIQDTPKDKLLQFWADCFKIIISPNFIETDFYNLSKKFNECSKNIIKNENINAIKNMTPSNIISTLKK